MFLVTTKYKIAFRAISGCLVLLFPILANSQNVDLNKTVSIHVEDSSLSYVLDEITRQADILFAINLERTDLNRKITLDSEHKKVSWVLNKICSGLNLEYKVVEKQVILKSKALSDKKKNVDQELYTISGFIRDMETGENLPGALIGVEKMQTGMATNSYGFYSLSLPSDTYNLKFTYLGYETIVRQIELSQNTRVDIDLPTNRVELKEVIVRPQEILLSDNNQASRLDINPYDINEISGFLGEPELIKSLQMQPGIKSYGDGSAFYYVRGGNKDQNQILIDEAPVFIPSHLFGFFTSFLPEAIQDVNVYKSDFPLKFGGFLSSIIDMKTREGNMKKLSGQGSIGIASNRFLLEGPIVKDHAAAFVSLRQSHFGKQLFNNSKFGFHDFNMKLNWRINNNNRIYFSIYNGSDKYFLSSQTRKNGLEWRNGIYSFRWNHLFSNKLFSNTTMYGSIFDYYLYPEEKRYWNERISTGALKTDFTYYLNGSNTIQFGGILAGYFFNPGNLNLGRQIENELTPIPQKNTRQATIYASDNMNVLKKVKLNFGLRYNLWQNFGPTVDYKIDTSDYSVIGESIDTFDNAAFVQGYKNLEPRMSVTYKKDSSQSFKFSFGRTVQYIHLLSNTATPFNSLDIWMPSGTNIKPQIANQYTLGYTKVLKKKVWMLNTEMYYKKMLNQIDYKDYPDLLLNPFIDRVLRFGKAWSYGIEVLLEKSSGRLNGQIGYSYSRVFKKIKDVNNGEKFPAYFDRPHEVMLSINYRLSGKWTLSSSWLYSSGAAITVPTAFYEYQGKTVPYYGAKNNGRLPDYHRLDVSANFRINRNFEKRFQHNLKMSIFNVYGRKNPFSINFNKATDGSSFYIPKNLILDEKLVPSQYYLLGIIPSISYNFKF